MKERSELVVNVPDNSDLVRPIDLKGMPTSSSVYKMDAGNEDTVHLLDYWRSIRKRLWLVIGITVLITSLTAIYMSRKPDIYDAQARVQVDLERPNPGLGVKDSQVIVNNSSNDPAYFNTQLQILTGPSLLRRVAKSLDLENNKEFLKNPADKSRSTTQSILRMIGLGEKEKPKQAEDEIPLTSSNSSQAQMEDLVETKRLAPYVEALQKGLTVSPVRESRLTVKETRLIDIVFRHNDPVIAAKIVNAIADTFSLQNLEIKTESNNTTGDFLSKRIAELQAEIRKGEERLVDYTRANDMPILDKEQNIVVERLAGLNRDYLKAQNERLAIEAEYRAALVPDAAGALAENSNLKRYLDEANLELTKLRQKRAELLVDNTEEWPEVKQVNEQIAEIERAIEDASKRAGNVVITNLATKYRQATANEASLKRAFDEQRSKTLNMNEAAINYKIIQQEIDTNKDLLNGLLQNSRENDIKITGTPNNIHVVDYALAPEEPIGPKRLMSVFAAFVLSLAFGAGLALFLEYLDDTVRSTDDVENLLRLPALAVIPSIEGMKGRRQLAAGNGNGNSNGINTTELLLHADARSSLAEAYRHLRTSVLLSTAGHAPKTLLVTSSVPSEGKTTTAVNTAISLSQTGAKVLIVDADMRRPRLHNIFQIENRQGLSSLLSREATEAEVLSMVTPYEDSNLHLLTSGPVPPNPAELIGSDQMRRLVGILENNYTHIVVDSPPIASFTDGVLISAMVDGVLLVVHAGKSSRGIVRRSRQLLLDVGAKIFGVVLNNVNLRSQDGYYYYQSYYQQAYYKGGEPSDSDHVATTGAQS